MKKYLLSVALCSVFVCKADFEALKKGVESEDIYLCKQEIERLKEESLITNEQKESLLALIPQSSYVELFTLPAAALAGSFLVNKYLLKKKPTPTWMVPGLTVAIINCCMFYRRSALRKLIINIPVK